jgi:hypothetical protein
MQATPSASSNVSIGDGSGNAMGESHSSQQSRRSSFTAVAGASPFMHPSSVQAPSGNSAVSYGAPTTAEVEELKRFLTTAPSLWAKADDPPIRQYQMANGELISCVFWRGKFFITGTDIVKILLFRFTQAGRPVLNVKKFEEGVFSDLRNLKPGTEAILEEPRSEFLEFLFKHGCIRTQKKQKVFFWYSVPHESLFLDAFERDFKREGSLYQFNMMLNQNRFLQKQVAMWHAAAIQQQLTTPPSGPTNSSANAAHPLAGMMLPQLMPNSLAAPSQAWPGSVPGMNHMYPPQQHQQQQQPQQHHQHLSNTVDPFLLGPSQMRMGKMALPASNSALLHQPQPASAFGFADLGDFDTAHGSSSSASALLDDPLLLGSGPDGGSRSEYVDPTRMMSLHEY